MKPQKYPAGTFGPVSAFSLIERDNGRMWND
jgi:glucose-6-phosphate 1-dehydrogenase